MYSVFNRPKTIPVPTGTEFETEYNIELDRNGHKVLIEAGKTNVYDIIQESYESTKIANIVQRATYGDPYVLQARNGQYIDISEMPTSLAEMQNLITKAKNEFDKLPIEIKEKFDNSAEIYIASYGSKEFYNKLGIQMETIEDPILDNVVKEGENNE